MTTREIIDTLRYMSVESMGAPEGVIVSRAVWEYGTLPEGSEKEELKKAIVDKAEQMKDKKTAVDGCEYPSAMNLLYAAYNLTGDETYKSVITELEKSETYMGLAFDMRPCSVARSITMHSPSGSLNLKRVTEIMRCRKHSLCLHSQIRLRPLQNLYMSCTEALLICSGMSLDSLLTGHGNARE